MRALWVGALLLAAVSNAGAAFLERDINNDGMVDALYDPVANLSWLADANYAATLGYWSHVFEPGAIDPITAHALAASLDVYGVTGWRLPRGQSAGCPSSYMQYCDAIGTTEFPSTAEGFRNIAMGLYFTDAIADGYWLLSAFPGDSNVFLTRSLERLFFAEFVHDGDVAVVPEPATDALMLLGLAGFAWRRAKRH